MLLRLAQVITDHIQGHWLLATRQEIEHARDRDEYHSDAERIEQIVPPSAIAWRCFHSWDSSRRSAGLLRRSADGLVVVRDTRPRSGRSIACVYNLSCIKLQLLLQKVVRHSTKVVSAPHFLARSELKQELERRVSPHRRIGRAVRFPQHRWELGCGTSARHRQRSETRRFL